MNLFNKQKFRNYFIAMMSGYTMLLWISFLHFFINYIKYCGKYIKDTFAQNKYIIKYFNNK